MLCVCSAVSLARRIAQVMTDPCYVFPYDSDDDDDDDDGVNVGLGRLSYDSSVSAAITLCTPLHPPICMVWWFSFIELYIQRA